MSYRQSRHSLTKYPTRHIARVSKSPLHPIYNLNSSLSKPLQLFKHHISLNTTPLTMNEEIKKIIEQVELARKPASSVPWKPDTPHPQPIYGFDSTTQTWKATADEQSQSDTTITKLALFSWNIDFMLPHARPRMEAGLAELQARISALPRSTAAVIFLQECVPADLETIGSTAWVRTGFLRTDVDAAFWASDYYGTTTLVDRRLGVARVSRTHYALTRMDRDALFVDVLGPSARDGEEESARGGDGAGSGKGRKKGGPRIIRFCNTHLESLALEPPYRPPQVALAAKLMREEPIHGALREYFLFLCPPPFPSIHAFVSFLSSFFYRDHQVADESRRAKKSFYFFYIFFCGSSP